MDTLYLNLSKIEAVEIRTVKHVKTGLTIGL